MDLEHLYDAILRTGRDQASPKLVAVPGESAEVFRLWDAEGKALQTHRKVPPSRKHTVGSLESFVQLVRVAAFAGAKETPPQHPAVWYSHERVVLLYDDDERYDRATCELGLSDQMGALADIATPAGKAFEQKALVRWLRVTMRGCETTSSDDLLREVRTVKFSKRSDDAAELEKTRASIGKSLQAEMVGAAGLPEYVRLRVPVFLNPHLAVAVADVEVAVEVDLAEQRFVLTLCPGEWERAVKAGEDYLAQDLTAELGPDVYLNHGAP